MRSHHYEFSGREFIRAMVPTVVVFTAVAVALNLIALTGWMREPPTALRADETGLRHQAKASRMRHPAEIVLLGDSTCSVGVDAPELSRQLPGQPPVINLALVIGISLGAYAQAAADFSTANSDQVRWVVLLVGPGKLAVEPGVQDELWRQILDEMHDRGRPPALWSNGDYLGCRFLRDRLACRILPEALHGRGAATFGFTTDLDNYFTAHHGSAIDFGEYVPRQDHKPAEWFLSPGFRNDCRLFRERMPRNVKLAIGLTPGPISTLAPEDTRRIYRELLQEWNALMQADLVLSNLPVVLPAPYISATAHLNASGQKVFTGALARELSLRPGGAP